MLLVRPWLLLLVCGSIAIAQECLTEQFTFFTVCTITVHYTGDPPTIEELMEISNEERKMEVRPLLCPCPEGKIGRFCPTSVYEFLKEFRHPKLCASYTPEMQVKK